MFCGSSEIQGVDGVRQGKVILPFELNQTVSDTNVSVTTVRTPDSIAV